MLRLPSFGELDQGLGVRNRIRASRRAAPASMLTRASFALPKQPQSQVPATARVNPPGTCADHQNHRRKHPLPDKLIRESVWTPVRPALEPRRSGPFHRHLKQGELLSGEIVLGRQGRARKEGSAKKTENQPDHVRHCASVQILSGETVADRVARGETRKSLPDYAERVWGRGRIETPSTDTGRQATVKNAARSLGCRIIPRTCTMSEHPPTA